MSDVRDWRQGEWLISLSLRRKENSFIFCSYMFSRESLLIYFQQRNPLVLNGGVGCQTSFEIHTKGGTDTEFKIRLVKMNCICNLYRSN